MSGVSDEDIGKRGVGTGREESERELEEGNRGYIPLLRDPRGASNSDGFILYRCKQAGKSQVRDDP
jgi:hypothetical protein